MLQISFPGLELIPPVTFKLCSGKGPVFISAQHITCKSLHWNTYIILCFSGLGKTLYFSSLLIHKCENAGCWLEIWIAMTGGFMNCNSEISTWLHSQGASICCVQVVNTMYPTWLERTDSPTQGFFFFSVDCIHFFNTMKTNKTGTNIDFQFAIYTAKYPPQHSNNFRKIDMKNCWLGYCSLLKYSMIPMYINISI